MSWRKRQLPPHISDNYSTRVFLKIPPDSSIAHRGYVLQTGEITVTDTAANLRDNAEVQKAYLGIS